MNIVVLQTCLTCGDTLICEYDPGFSGDRWEPPQPAFWYSTNEEKHIGDDADTTADGVWKIYPIFCDHEASYTKEQFDEFQASCGQLADESFEPTQFEWL